MIAFMRKRTFIVVAAAAFELAWLMSTLAFLVSGPVRRDAMAAAPPAWREVSWPFPMDQWGTGTAFQCAAADCGSEVTIYLRPKIGFCNCTTGMTNDADLDRVGDFDLFGGALYPQAPGQPVKAGWMTGRSRPFAVRTALHGDATIISIGLHDNCDALVATAVLERGQLTVAEPAVRDFLNSRTMAEWAQTTLGL